MKKKINKIQHKIGKHTGYNIYPDGSIEIAPMYQSTINDYHAEVEGIRKVLEIVTQTSEEKMTRLEKAKHEFWVRIKEDVGIDPKDDNWYYNNGKLFRQEEKK